MNERLEYLRKQLQAECLSYGEIAELQDLSGHIAEGDNELLEAAGVPEGATYYERVRNEVERVCECTTSDAQSILGAWARKQYGHRGTDVQDMEECALGDAEDAGTTPADLVNQILN